MLDFFGFRLRLFYSYVSMEARFRLAPQGSRVCTVTAEPPALTATSHAILALLALREGGAYDVTERMETGLRFYWPRARSKLYEEPKKLVANGLAKACEQTTGKRRRVVYRITPKGRRALAQWLSHPGGGPVLE